MKLNEIREHYINFQEWLQSLKALDDREWFAPIAEGKWSIAAIVSHLLSWDRYSFQHLFPNFKEGAALDGFPDFQEVNQAADKYAHSGMTKEQLLDEILGERQHYFTNINEYSEEDLTISFTIGNHNFSIDEYFKDFIGHDIHHQKQIMEKINSFETKVQ